MKNTITYVAMDTYKKEHKIALHYPGHEEIFRFAVRNTVRDIKKIEALGCKCMVIAPSLTPIKPGDHVKKAGLLTEVRFL